jgi:hypothetical protein
MLVLSRKEGEWLTITDRQSGRSVRVRVNQIRSGRNVDLVFDDESNSFAIERAERAKPAPHGFTAAQAAMIASTADVPVTLR